MANVGAPKGNNNGGKGKVVRSVIAQRLAERAALTEMVDRLIDQAIEGDKAAIGMIFDRVDGKPAQSIEASGPDGGAIEISRIERVITDPANRNP